MVDAPTNAAEFMTSPLVQENLWIVGAVIIGAIGAQALWLTVDFFRRAAHENAQRARIAELLELRLAAARTHRAEQEKKSFSWAGWRKFEVKRREFADPSSQACSFYLAPHDGKPIPAFEPGQFLTFQLAIPGQAKPAVRCYSLSDSPRSDHYRVTIKRLPGRGDAPPGLASNFFHDHIGEGDLVDVRAPSGRFFLDMTHDTPVVLLAAGVGITPVLCMLNAIVDSGSSRETWFLFGVRHGDEHIMREHLDRVAREHENVHLHVCYSNPRDGVDVRGTDYHHSGYVSTELLRELLPSSNYDFYMCGPPPMMDSLTEGLLEWGVPEERVHFEKFGPAPGKPKPKPDTSAKGPPVTFKKSGRTIPWDAAFEHVWDFAAANGVEIDSGCLEGNCGSCMTAILSGEVTYADEPSFPYEKGTCLTCSCVPNGPLELDA